MCNLKEEILYLPHIDKGILLSYFLIDLNAGYVRLEELEGGNYSLEADASIIESLVFVAKHYNAELEEKQRNINQGGV